MSRLLQFFQSAYNLASIGVLTAFFGARAILMSMLGYSTERVYENARGWARLCLAANGVRLHVENGDAPEFSAPTIVMTNHRSHLDTPALIAASRKRLSFVAKRELRKVPFMGRAMEKLQMIFVDRSNSQAARESMAKTAQQVRDGLFMVMFPEGTRSKDGVHMNPLKKGGFHVALDARAVIQPVVLLGSERALPKYSLTITPTTITVRWGAPIAVGASDDIETLMARTRAEFERLIALGEAESAASPALSNLSDPP